MRLLLSAFSFSPVRGSEAAVGWNTAIQLAKHADVTVLFGDIRSDRRSLNDLNTYLQTSVLPPRLTTRYIGPLPLISLFERLHYFPCLWMLYYLGYRLWQKEALRIAARLHLETPFDICHHLTYIGFREPGYLWKLGLPFVWGPVSGAESIPFSFYKHFSNLEIFRPLSRDIGNIAQSLFPGRIRSAAQHAAKVFAVSEAENQLFKRWNVNSELLLETGTTPNPMRRLRTSPKQKFVLIWSGLFTPRKALPILLKALSSDSIPLQRWKLLILGNGPMEKAWKTMASKCPFADDNIEWKGRVSHEDALRLMATGDILIHTGLREGTPHVILEALSLGMPVVCHHAGGMSTAVTDDCGVTIPLVNFEYSVTHFRHTLERFIEDPHLLPHLSQGALARARNLSWESIAERFVVTYQSILRSDPPKQQKPIS